MKFDVLIVGAGLSGASLACALRSSRLRVGLLDRTAPGRSDGWDARIYAISPANVKFLEQCGVWPHLEASRIVPVEHMEVYGDAGGRLKFGAYECGLEALAWMVESSRIACELWETARRQSNVEMICPAIPQQIVWPGDKPGDVARLTLTDGRVLEADLIVAADGANSWVRERAGIRAPMRPYHEMGMVANFQCESPHHNTAFQWFRHDGILAYLPLPGNMISIVWSAPDEYAQSLLDLSAEALCTRVAEAAQYRLGSLSLATPAVGFPLRLMRAQTCVAPHRALIGDAAHAIHPLSGHGINLGFQDAKVLADVLLASSDFCSCGELSTLRRYARQRAEEVRLVQGVTHGLSRLFRPQLSPLSALRNTGMTLMGSLPFVKSALTRYAAGLY